jgi:hypothetical protein
MSESDVPTSQIGTKQMTPFSKKSLSAYAAPVEFSGQNLVQRKFETTKKAPFLSILRQTI